MLGSTQSRQGTSSDVFRTVISAEMTNIFLKAAAEAGTEIAFVEISAQKSEFIDGKAEPESEIDQREVLVEMIWETKKQGQDFWIAFDNEWRKANC